MLSLFQYHSVLPNVLCVRRHCRMVPSSKPLPAKHQRKTGTKLWLIYLWLILSSLKSLLGFPCFLKEMWDEIIENEHTAPYLYEWFWHRISWSFPIEKCVFNKFDWLPFFSQFQSIIHGVQTIETTNFPLKLCKPINKPFSSMESRRLEVWWTDSTGLISDIEEIKK